jgi:hypothetical protein
MAIKKGQNIWEGTKHRQMLIKLYVFCNGCFLFFWRKKKKKANSRHVDECHNKNKDRDPVKEQVNWAQNSFLERGPSWIVVMSRMLASERKKLQSFTNWTTTHIWHGLFFKKCDSHIEIISQVTTWITIFVLTCTYNVNKLSMWHVIHKDSSSGNLHDKFFSILVKFIKLKDLRKKIMECKNEKNEMKLISSSYLLVMELVIPSPFHEPR